MTVTTAPTEAAAEVSVPVEEETIPEEETVAEETEIPEQTQPAVQSGGLPALPQVEEGPCHFFDDAAFLGDSISYSLYVHHVKTKDLGGATFFVSKSLGLQNILQGILSVSYQGVSMAPWDALAASGVKKVFIMLGTNDIGYYGIDETMARWEVFLEKIREASPDLEIYIQSLTPMWKGAEQQLLNNANIDLYNTRLEEFAQANGCHFLNFSHYFKNSENGLAVEYVGDLYVHMNEAGTAAWATLLKAYGQEQEMERS